MQNKSICLEQNTICFSHIGREWRILRADMEVLWEAMVQNATSNEGISVADDERLPYWAELWPSSLALASWLATKQADINQKVCMDLGCGLGFTALCAATLGANVLGVDYEPNAIQLACENASANGFLTCNAEEIHKQKKYLDIFLKHNEHKQNAHNFYYAQTNNPYKPQTPCTQTHRPCVQTKTPYAPTSCTPNPCTPSPCANVGEGSFGKDIFSENTWLAYQVMDWRKPHIKPKSIDYLWGADIVYERAFVEPVITFLDYAITESGKAWIAEPSRTVFDYFHEKIAASPLQRKKVFSEQTHALSPQIPMANVNIWEITRKI